MRKPDSLRAALAQAAPELAQDPARLKIWIEKGTVQSHQTESGGMMFAYQLNVLAVALSADVGILALAMFDWLRIEQPERLSPGDGGVQFDADILDNKTADVLFQLDLTEMVTVARGDDGTATLTYRPEPSPLFDDDLGLGDPPLPAPWPPLVGADLEGEGPVI